MTVESAESDWWRNTFVRGMWCQTGCGTPCKSHLFGAPSSVSVGILARPGEFSPDDEIRQTRPIVGDYPECQPQCAPWCDGHPSASIAGGGSFEPPERNPPLEFEITPPTFEGLGEADLGAGFGTELRPLSGIEEMRVGEEFPKLAVLGSSSLAVQLTFGNRPPGRRRALARICTCGHSIGAHRDIGDEWMCTPSAHTCECRSPYALLEVGDARFFTAKTGGAGPRHALTKGILRAQQSGVSVESIRELACWRCRQSSDQLVPVPFSHDWEGKLEPVSGRGGKATGLYCPDCADEIGVALSHPGELR
jgi:hypothetical protein